MRHACEAYSDPEEVARFLVDHLPSKKAAEMLDLEVQKPEAWCLSWELEALSGIGRDGRAVCLFRREDVERLKAEFFASR